MLGMSTVGACLHQNLASSGVFMVGVPVEADHADIRQGRRRFDVRSGDERGRQRRLGSQQLAGPWHVSVVDGFSQLGSGHPKSQPDDAPS